MEDRRRLLERDPCSPGQWEADGKPGEAEQSDRIWIRDGKREPPRSAASVSARLDEILEIGVSLRFLGDDSALSTEKIGNRSGAERRRWNPKPL
jgi:hypothetical protein